MPHPVVGAVERPLAVTTGLRHYRGTPLRLAALLLFLAAAWLASAAATAQPSPAAPSPLPAQADISLLGPAPATTAVKDVTSELLARKHVEVSWAVQDRFRPQDIFARDATASSAAIAVWIDLSAATEAELYFRDSRADRFFLRSVPLSGGIDEMAIEEIAHIVANAVLALSTGLGESLTRAEARVALHMPREPELRAADPPSPWRASAGVLLGGQRFADDLPVVANASGMLTLTHRLSGSGRNALGGWASLGYQFAANYRGTMVGATVESTALRAGVLWTGELSRRVVLGIALGAGMDRIHYSPQAMLEAVTVAPGGTFYVPAAGLWAGLDFRLVGGLALTVHLSCDALLKQVRFDLHDSDGQVSHVFEPYSLRPGAAFGLAYSF